MSKRKERKVKSDGNGERVESKVEKFSDKEKRLKVYNLNSLWKSFKTLTSFDSKLKLFKCTN